MREGAVVSKFRDLFHNFTRIRIFLNELYQGAKFACCCWMELVGSPYSLHEKQLLTNTLEHMLQPEAHVQISIKSVCLRKKHSSFAAISDVFSFVFCYLLDNIYAKKDKCLGHLPK